MRFRTIAGALMVLAVAGVISLDAFLFYAAKPLAFVLLLLMASRAWWEYAAICGLRGEGPKASRALFWWGQAGIVFFFLAARASAGETGTGLESGRAVAGLISLLAGAFLLVMFRESFERLYPSLLEVFAGVALLGLCLSYYVRVYMIPGGLGPLLAAILVAGVKGNDTAAYYVGKSWGTRHIFRVSPKKTLEGSIGALLFSALYFGAAALAVEHYRPGSLFPWYSGILFGMMVSVLAQAGDLAESLIKRVYKTKDSGSLLPEFGGVLDMLDSLIFPGCFFWIWRSVQKAGWLFLSA